MPKITVFDVLLPSDPSGDVVLINAEGRALDVGCIVHVVTGANIGRAYRYEGLHATDLTYRVKVSRKAPHGHFRAIEWMHPSMLGCTVLCPRSRRERCRDGAVHLWHRFDEWIMAGVFALVPLALFEHFHMADNITEAVTLGLISGGGGHH